MKHEPDYFSDSGTSIADHSDKLRLWVLSELVEKGQGYQRSQRVQDRAILRLSRGPEVLVTPVRSYSKIALFLTTSNQNKDMSDRPSQLCQLPQCRRKGP